MIPINWPLLILTDSPGFPRNLTIVGMVKMCGNEAKVTNKRFGGNWGNLYTRDLPHSNIFLLSNFNLKCFIDTKVLYTYKKYGYTLWSKLCMGYTNMNTDSDLYYDKSKNRAIRFIVALYSYRCIPSTFIGCGGG